MMIHRHCKQLQGNSPTWQRLLVLMALQQEQLNACEHNPRISSMALEAFKAFLENPVKLDAGLLKD